MKYMNFCLFNFPKSSIFFSFERNFTGKTIKIFRNVKIDIYVMQDQMNLTT